MRKHSNYALIVALLLVVLTALCACRNTPVPTPPATPVPTPTPIPKIVGEEVQKGLIDISAHVKQAVGETYHVEDVAYCGEDKLLIAAANETASKLLIYDATTAEAVYSYDMPLKLNEITRYASHGTFNITSDGVVVIDFKSGDIYKLDDTLTEVARYNGAAPAVNEEMYSELSLDYSEADNSIYYAYFSGNPVIYKKTLADGNVTEVFSSDCEGDHVTFTLSEDGAYLNADISNYSGKLPEGRSTAEFRCIIDAATGEIKDETWLNIRAYSDGDNYAVNQYYNYTSRMVVNGVTTDIDFIQEYVYATVDFASDTVITVANADVNDSNELMFTAYNTSDGKRMARVMLSNPDGFWVETSRGILSNDVATFDNKRGTCCFSYFQSTDEYSTAHTFIWSPKDSVDTAPTDVADKLTASPEGELPETITVETNNALQAEIEERYNTKLYYGKSLRDYIKKTKLGTSVVTSFSDNADPRYIYECLRLYNDCLGEYPAGMLDKISSTDDGPLRFLLVTSLEDTMLDFTICGQYMSMGGEQQVIVLCPLGGMSDFRKGGSTGVFRSIIHHEICHAMQRCIFSYNTGDLRYDTDTYLGLYPKDFKFQDDENSDKYVYSGKDNAYFVDDYSMTSILEDMSRMYEYSMWDEIPECMYYPHINARYKYLCQLIRSTFGNDTWDEVMYWERCVVGE